MKQDEFELRIIEKQVMRDRELELINGDPSKALELGRRNFCLKGADLQAARIGKNFVIIRDNDTELDLP